MATTASASAAPAKSVALFKPRAIAAPPLSALAPIADAAAERASGSPRSASAPPRERSATDAPSDITRAPWMPSTTRPAVSDELADALAKLAAEAAVPVSATNAPFYTVAQREAMAQVERRRRRLRWAKRFGVAAAAGLALVVVVTQFFFRTPDPEALAAHAQAIAAAVVPLYADADQPLRLDAVQPVLRERVDGRHFRYFAQITLRLQQPLYEPGTSNGTVAYRQLQAALGEARTSDLKFKLLPGMADIPTLPPLVQLTHRAGDPVVIDVPFSAERGVRRWRFSPPELAKRTVKPALHGSSYAREGPGGFFVVSAPGTAAVIRARMASVRKYILAIAAEEQRRGIVRGQAEPAAAPALPKLVLPDFDPDALAVPEAGASAKRAAVDPNAPAVAPKADAVDPNAPAVNPDAPATPDPNAPARPPAKR